MSRIISIVALIAVVTYTAWLIGDAASGQVESLFAGINDRVGEVLAR